jgi:hypothetical protein
LGQVKDIMLIVDVLEALMPLDSAGISEIDHVVIFHEGVRNPVPAECGLNDNSTSSVLYGARDEKVVSRSLVTFQLKTFFLCSSMIAR